MEGVVNVSAPGNATVPPIVCGRSLPHASVFMSSLSTSGYILFAFLVIFTITTIVIYIEEVIFIMKAFKLGFRKKKTIYVLSVFPMWSVLGLIAVCVPRAGPLIDMVANMFFGTCLYNFGKLMVHYMSGAKGLWRIIGLQRRIQTNTLPLCCCCPCLPKLHFTPIRYFIINILVMQIAIVRPILWFTAAVFWTNDAYVAGLVSFQHSFVYLLITNMVSTCTAVYGLMLLRNAFRPELEKQFFIMGKFASVQLTLILGSLVLIILAILIGNGVIGCSPLLSPKGRADEIYHCIVVLLMLPLSLLGRKSFRRVEDGYMYAQSTMVPPQQQQQQQQVLTGENGDIVKKPLNGDADHVIVVATATDSNGNPSGWPALPETKSLNGKLDAANESNV